MLELNVINKTNNANLSIRYSQSVLLKYFNKRINKPVLLLLSLL